MAAPYRRLEYQLDGDANGLADFEAEETERHRLAAVAAAQAVVAAKRATEWAEHTARAKSIADLVVAGGWSDLADRCEALALHLGLPESVAYTATDLARERRARET